MKTNIEIPVADLKSVLPGLSKIVSKRTSLPVLGCVKVTLGSDRHLRLQANNLDQIVTARLNKPFNGKPGDMLIPLEELSGIAKRCAANDIIELSVDGKETSITYTAAGTRIKKPLKHVALDEFPSDVEVNTEPVKLDEAFKEALQQALDCASTDQSRYVLNGACLDVSKKEAHYVVGTDGRHLFSANSFLFDVPESIIVPSGKFLTWSGFMEDGPWTLRFQPGTKPSTAPKIAGKPAWVRLDSEHWTYVSKPIEGPYPNWKTPVPEERSLKSHIVLGEQGTNVILDALPLLPGQDDLHQPVTLEIKDDALSLKAKGKEGKEWTVIPIPAKVSGLPVSITLNRTYLAKALKFGLTQIGIVAHDTPMVFSAEGRILVVCPIGPPPVGQPPNGQPPAAPSTAGQPASPLENVSTAAPSPVESTVMTANERNQTVSQNTMTAPQRGNLTGQAPESESSAIDEMAQQLGVVRDGVKKALDDLAATERLLRRVAKEQKLNEKEMGKARSALRSLQNVAI